MKKNYTLFLLLLTFSFYAQDVKVKETAEKGVYFKQNGGKIEIHNGVPSEGNANVGYVFTSSKDGALEVRRSGISASAYSSPNDIVVIQDAAGNRYWRLIDGTIAKTELAGEVTSSPVKKDIPNRKIEKKKESEDRPVFTTSQEDKEAIKVEVPNTTKKDEVVNSVPVAPAPVKEKIIIEEVKTPEEEIVITKTDGDEIQITNEEVGDVSELFEKNYEDMTRKEKKLYRKNEKKIMRQLEKELKNGENN